MRTAAALEAGERLLDLGIGWFFLLIEERCRCHDPTVDAIPALRHLLLDIGLLDRVRMFRSAEAGKRHHLGVAHRGNRRDAGAHRLAIDVDSASAALGETATKV